jgi:aminoglycoside phosphotransferase (APT) family kinase protein
MQGLQEYILKHVGASEILRVESVQTLWSGYGQIKRYTLSGGDRPSVIAKYVQWPKKNHHPRGWNTSFSHQRKLSSYQVERQWYDRFSSLTNACCKVPELIHAVEKESQLLLIMEDLDESGYHLRLDPETVKLDQVKSVLRWLAHFHATFIGKAPVGLWSVGTYWHLDTRPEEWESMQNDSLKEAARAIDNRLNQAQFQTLVHGDAKLANFCFGEMNEVAAVDFQYVGKGCGMKDVAYFISSCFDEEDCVKYEKVLLDHYFEQLGGALGTDVDFESLRNEWRDLYTFAWADFYRFLDGWSPGHWKMHEYSRRITQQVINQLSQHEA